MATVSYTTAGSGTWTALATSVDVECWGGGGGGGESNLGYGGGAGGGAYAKSTNTGLTKGTAYAYVVGAAGASSTLGGSSTWRSTVVVAVGGPAGNDSAFAGGAAAVAGGAAASCTGTTKYSGGGGSKSNSTIKGGGGGGSAGTGGAGTTAVDTSTGASAVTGGGPGGNGATTDLTAGSAPVSGPGGGGGGGRGGYSLGGAGWAGQIVLTYTPSYDITSSVSGGNGTISPVGVTSVLHGSNQAYNTYPSTGYHLDHLLVDGGWVSAQSPYTFSNVTATHTIVAYFSINTYQIASSAGANGTISPSTASYNHGATQAFTMTANSGYHLASVTVDSVAQAVSSPYTFTNITAAHTISCTFASNTQTVSPTGIASGQAFGSPTITPGHVDVGPTGIVSAEAFGTVALALQIRPVGIVSEETVGSPTVSGATIMLPTGIASAEAFGAPSFVPGHVDVAPSGIASREALGSPVITRIPVITVVAPNGGEFWPTGSVQTISWNLSIPVSVGEFYAWTVDVDGTWTFIVAVAANGTTAYSVPWTVNVPARADYKLAVYYTVAVPGTWAANDWSDAFFSVSLGVYPAGIASAEVFGSPTVVKVPIITVRTPNTAGPFAQGAVVPVAWDVANSPASGIFHVYAFNGAYTYLGNHNATGAASYSIDWVVAQASGTYVVRIWYVDTFDTWMAFGDSTPVFAISAISVDPSGIASSEGFGTATVTPGHVHVSPTAIASAEAFGAPVVTRPGPAVVRDYVKVFTAANVFVGLLPAAVRWTQRLNGADTLDSVRIPAEYLKQDGTTESRVAFLATGWYVEWDGARYVVDSVSSDRETGLEFTATSAEIELANFLTNYSPGPATYLNRTPTQILTALLAGRIGRSLRNAGFGILDSGGLPTNWTHPAGWASATIANRRVWQAAAGTAESVSDLHPCALGTSYRFTVQAQAPAGMAGNVGIKIRWRKSDGTTVDSAATNLTTKDGTFHEVATTDLVALGNKYSIVLVTSASNQATQFDDVAAFEIGPATGWTYSGSRDTRAAAIPFTDGAIEKYGVWTAGATYIASTAVGDYIARIVNGSFVTIGFAAGGTGATCKVRVNGVQYQASGTSLVCGATPIDVSAAVSLTCSGLDPANDHIVEVEVAAVTTRVTGFTVSTVNLISMRWDFKSVYEAIASVRLAVGGELTFNTATKVITHAATRGQNLTTANVIDFRRASNIVKFEKNEDRTKIVNALTFLGYGEGEYQLVVTALATGTSGGSTSQALYGTQRGTYTNKDCKALATAVAEAQRLVELSAFPLNSYSVQVTDSSADVCAPGDTGHFVYATENLELRILEITREAGGAVASFVVGNKVEDVSDYVLASRRELATLNKSYQGVPTDSNDSFSEQFERTAGGVDVPATIPFFIPYGADLLDLRLRYQVGGMRAFAKGAASGGGATSTSVATPSGGGATSGGGGSSTPTSDSVSTPSGGGSTTPSGGGSTSGSGTQTVVVSASTSREIAVVNTFGSVIAPGMNGTNYPTQVAQATVFNRTASAITIAYEFRRDGPAGTLITSGSSIGVAANGYVQLAYTWGSYAPDGVCFRAKQEGSGTTDIDIIVALTGYTSHTHTTPSHTHSTPDHTHPAHSHTVTIASHTHTTPDHTHPAHSHDVSAHAHTLVYGIYESSVPSTGIRVYLDNMLITALNGLAIVSDFDLMPFVGKDSNGRVQEGWHEVAFKSAVAADTGSVRGCLFGQKFLSTEAL